LRKIKIPIIKPIIDAKFNLILNEIISRLKPIGPVRLSVIIFSDGEGNNFTIKFPSADPKTAPRIIKAIKYPIFDLSKTIYDPDFIH
jgi:hypothetical protein